MSFTVDAAHLGTKESTWRASTRLTRCRRMTWDAPGKVVVIAPHPDDEILAVGGTMLTLARGGHPIGIVAVTDGEASHPRARHVTPAALGARRTAERESALLRLGVHADVARLRCPDGGVAGVPALGLRLAPLLHGAAWCLAPWDLDGHPDHDAAGRAAALACAATGVRLVQYPVWAWHWASPETAEFPWNRARRVPLPADVLRAKESAIAAYASQVAPLDASSDDIVLPPEVLARFERPFEVVFA